MFLQFYHAVDVLKKLIDCLKTGILELDRTEYQKITAMHKGLKESIADLGKKLLY